MPTTRDQLSDNFTPIFDEFMLMGFNEDAQKGKLIFDWITDTTKEHKFSGISGTGEWEESDELAGGQYEDLVNAYDNTITPLKYRKKIKVSFEATLQDEYAMLKSKCVDAHQIGKGGRVKVEKLQAEILYGVFSTAGPDGQYLASNSHPKNSEETGITYDNLLDGPLSHDNLELAEKQMAAEFFDLKGLPIEVDDNPLLVGPSALKGTIERLLSDRANERPGVPDGLYNPHEINRFAGRYTPVIWRYLDSAMGGTDTQWHIIFKGMKFLELVWAWRPYFDNWIDKDIDAYIFKGSMMCAAGCNDWRYGFSSTGL